MSKNTKLKILTILCAAVLTVAAGLGVIRIFGAAGGSYAHAEQYTAGDAEITGPVRHLDIHWVNGRVNIAYHAGSTVMLSETADKSLSEAQRMRWWLDGDTLRVQFSKPGLRFSRNPEKELTVTLPEGLDLGDVSIGATSGDISIPALRSETLTIGVTSGDIEAGSQAVRITCTSTSGDIDLTASENAKDIAVTATSGCITLQVPDSAAGITVSSTSGNIRLEAGEVQTVNLTSTSGSISAAVSRAQDVRIHSTSGNILPDVGSVEKTAIESTSGTVTLKLGAFGTLSIHTTSGDVTAALKAEPGFTGRLHATSGKITHDLPLAAQGDAYVCGDGSGTVDISTTSGNIRIGSNSD